MTTGTYRYQDGWKWFLPASRTSLNPPGPSTKAKNLSFRTRNFRETNRENFLISLINPFLGGPPRRDGPGVRSISYHRDFLLPRLGVYAASCSPFDGPSLFLRARLYWQKARIMSVVGFHVSDEPDSAEIQWKN